MNIAHWCTCQCLDIGVKITVLRLEKLVKDFLLLDNRWQSVDKASDYRPILDNTIKKKRELFKINTKG